MRVKAIAVLIVVAVSAGLFVLFHDSSRADAAGGDCYSDGAGPSTPQICN